MNMKSLKNILRIGALASLLVLTSCDKFPLQTSEDFEDSTLDPTLNMSAWEYIESDLVTFSSMKNAIEIAGMEEEYKSGSDKTFLLLNNTALDTYFANNLVSNPNYTGATANGPEFITPIDFTNYPLENVIELLEYHILDQRLAITDANGVDEDSGSDGAYQEDVWYKTRAYKKYGDTALICAWWERNSTCSFYFNYFSGHYTSSLKPTISNMVATNGVVHVFSKYLQQPSEANLEKYGVDY